LDPRFLMRSILELTSWIKEKALEAKIGPKRQEAHIEATH